MAVLTLRLLGPPCLATATGEVRMRRRQPLALLAYLALAPGAVSRDQLALLLFGNRDDAAARGRLRRVLHELRQILHQHGCDRDLVRVRGEAIALDHARCAVDARALLAAAAAPPDPAALELYRGPFLDGLCLEGAPDFNDWLLQTGEQLEQTRVRLLHGLAVAALHRRDGHAAAHYAQALVAADPINEESHLVLIEAYAAQGQTSLMHRQYSALCELLRSELDIAPLPETQARYTALREQVCAPLPIVSRGSAAPLLRTPPFVGRAAEMHALLAAYQQACDTGFHVAVVHGPSGIGKTRLVSEAWAMLCGQARPPHVLHAIYYATPPATPYQALLEALGIAGRSMRRAGLGARASRVENAEQRVWEQLATLLLGFGAGAAGSAAHLAPPLAIAIDNLQWADNALVRALPYLLRRLAAPGTRPCLVTLTIRSDEQPPTMAALLRQLARDATTTWVDVPALGADEVRQLVQAYVERDQLPVRLAQMLIDDTAGNPFFVVETLRDLHERGMLQGERSAAVAELPLPRTVRVVIEDRLARLPAQAQQLADAAAVIGRDIDLDLLRQSTSLREEALVEALELLEQSGIVMAQTQGSRFAHGTLQSVLYNRLSTARRRLLHRRIAHALAGAAPSRAAATLLAHAQRAHAWELAFQAARQAAAQARGLVAHADAAAFERAALVALDALGNHTERRFETLLACEDDEHITGQREAQQRTLDALAQHAQNASQRAELLYRRGRLLHMLNQARHGHCSSKRSNRRRRLRRAVRRAWRWRCAWTSCMPSARPERRRSRRCMWPHRMTCGCKPISRWRGSTKRTRHTTRRSGG